MFYIDLFKFKLYMFEYLFECTAQIFCLTLININTRNWSIKVTMAIIIKVIG